MATYLVLANCVQGAQTSVSVAPNVPSLSGVSSGSLSSYFYQGDTPTDTQLGGSTPVNTLLGYGAIALIS